MQVVTIKPVDVELRLKRLDPNKSVGPDGAHPQTLRGPFGACSPLTKLFEKSLDTKVVPQDWRNENITHVHKGGSRNNVTNYQPISITLTVCKILEGIVNTAITKHLPVKKLLTNSQHGFRLGHSVETKLKDAYDYITKFLDLNTPVDMILLDCAKVFDNVCHCWLKIKLIATRIHLEVVEWVSFFQEESRV